MNKMKIITIMIGMLIGITGLVLAWVFYGWELVLVLTLVIWGDNIQKKLGE